VLSEFTAWLWSLTAVQVLERQYPTIRQSFSKQSDLHPVKIALIPFHFNVVFMVK
jgi:hypothetical protein